MDAFKLLKADHRKVDELFKQLERTNGKQKLTVFEQIKMELDLHAHIEEKIFYPALEDAAETRDIVLEAYEEHKQVKTLLRELSRARNADEDWEAKAKVLQENVEHHVQEEENELFKQANAALSDEEVLELGTQLSLEKERMQGRAGAKKSASKSAGKLASKSARASSGKKSTKASGKSASSKKGGSKKRPAKKAAKKTGTKKAGGSKSARTGR
jgi:hemerythrin-like domain-containing protein